MSLTRFVIFDRLSNMSNQTHLIFYKINHAFLTELLDKFKYLLLNRDIFRIFFLSRDLVALSIPYFFLSFCYFTSLII